MRAGGPGTEAAKANASAARSPSAPPGEVRLRWLLTALGLLVLAALACAYLSLCLLFLGGQWQLLYQPSREVKSTPASVGLAFSEVRFAADEAGIPQLTGWWVPGSSQTILYLHEGSGSLADALPAIRRLHELDANVLAIDYRGFGASAGRRPGEDSMVEDARSAYVYLTQTRHVAPETIVIWGTGLGATIAAEAEVGNRLVLQRLSETALERLRRDPRTRLLPLRLLLRDRLDPTHALRSYPAAKLFLRASGPGQAGQSDASERFYPAASELKALHSETDSTGISAFVGQPIQR